MPKRLAITIAGAVSLGSYEAGVLYEVIEALRQHNEDPRTSDHEKIEIDVLTGASAGGMTATIAAQKLLFNAPALRDPVKNSFRQPWVDDIDIDDMLHYTQGEDEFASIFSSALIGRIADKHLLARYDTNPPPAQQRHPAAAQTIRLGLALSNLNGVDYERTLDNDRGTFTYTRFQDELLVALSANSDNRPTWEPLRTAALSCGAFPFAFRLVELIRSNVDYQQFHYFVPFQPTPPGTAKHAYTDGGLFQNEPLGIAKHFVDEIDNHQNEETRFYLFVAPGTKESAAALPTGAAAAPGSGAPALPSGDRAVPPAPAARKPTTFTADANMAQTAGRLASAVFWQSRFHDWIEAEDMNDRVRLFNQRSRDLKDSMLLPATHAQYIDWQSLRPAANALLPVLFAQSATTPANALSARIRAAETLPHTRERLRGQFDPEYKELVAAPGLGAAAADTWLDSILAFEKAAELHSKDEMHIYGITATQDQLASELVFSFAGFLDHRLREHDYIVGRCRAQKFLSDLNTSAQQPNDPGLGPIRYRPQALPVLPALGNIRLKDIDRDKRVALRDRLLGRVSRMLEQFGAPGWIVAPLRWWFLRPKADKYLDL
jgi:hypothetical protein